MANYNDLDLVCIAGKAGSGKDTLADMMAERDGYVKFSFADPLKEMCIGTLGLSRDDVYTSEGKRRFVPEWGMTVREILQRVGTEAMRNGFDRDVWVKVAHRKVSEILASGKRVVMPDCRFDNEAEMAIGLGGCVVRISRPGAGLSGFEGGHPSEAGISGKLVAVEIENSLDIPSLYSMWSYESRRYAECGAGDVSRMAEEATSIPESPEEPGMLRKSEALELVSRVSYFVKSRMRGTRFTLSLERGGIAGDFLVDGTFREGAKAAVVKFSLSGDGRAGNAEVFGEKESIVPALEAGGWSVR